MDAVHDRYGELSHLRHSTLVQIARLNRDHTAVTLTKKSDSEGEDPKGVVW